MEQQVKSSKQACLNRSTNIRDNNRTIDKEQNLIDQSKQLQSYGSSTIFRLGSHTSKQSRPRISTFDSIVDQLSQSEEKDLVRSRTVQRSLVGNDFSEFQIDENLDQLKQLPLKNKASAVNRRSLIAKSALHLSSTSMVKYDVDEIVGDEEEKKEYEASDHQYKVEATSTSPEVLTSATRGLMTATGRSTTQIERSKMMLPPLSRRVNDDQLDCLLIEETNDYDFNASSM